MNPVDAAKAPEKTRLGLLRFITCGSVDDGKSTLVGQMLMEADSIYEDQVAAVRKASNLRGGDVDLSFFTDGLKSEREQGITIDVAYRYFSTPRRRFIIADAPGHEQYTRNMATGASTADLAVIIIDARHGVVTQTKRHSFIVSLLGIRHIVVVVNKMDLADYSRETYDGIVRDFKKFSDELSLPELVFMPVSALHADNVTHRSGRMPWYDGPPLMTYLEEVDISSKRNLTDFRFPVQFVIRPNQDFRGYAGTVSSGVARVGDEIVALPSMKRSRVKSIETWDGPLDYAFPPQSVVLCLEDELDVSRGDILAHPSNPPEVRKRVEANLVWMNEEPFQRHKSYVFKHATRTIRGKINDLYFRINPNNLRHEEAKELRLNEIGRVGIDFSQSIVCDSYQQNNSTGAFIAIDPITNVTLAAGMILRREEWESEGLEGAAETPAASPPRTESLVSGGRRAEILGQRAVAVWLTGPAGAGKTAVAYALEKRLAGLGRAAFVLDEDNLRHGLCRGLGRSADEEAEALRQMAETAALMCDAGLIVACAHASPSRASREAAVSIIGRARFTEAFLDAPAHVRDLRADRGIGDAGRKLAARRRADAASNYEPPQNPALRLDSNLMNVEECVERIVLHLKNSGVLTAD